MQTLACGDSSSRWQHNVTDHKAPTNGRTSKKKAERVITHSAQSA